LHQTNRKANFLRLQIHQQCTTDQNKVVLVLVKNHSRRVPKAIFNTLAAVHSG
jgi:hypothetical protein